MIKYSNRSIRRIAELLESGRIKPQTIYDYQKGLHANAMSAAERMFGNAGRVFKSIDPERVAKFSRDHDSRNFIEKLTDAAAGIITGKRSSKDLWLRDSYDALRRDLVESKLENSFTPEALKARGFANSLQQRLANNINALRPVKLENLSDLQLHLGKRDLYLSDPVVTALNRLNSRKVLQAAGSVPYMAIMPVKHLPVPPLYTPHLALVDPDDIRKRLARKQHADAVAEMNRLRNSRFKMGPGADGRLDQQAFYETVLAMNKQLFSKAKIYVPAGEGERGFPVSRLFANPGHVVYKAGDLRSLFNTLNRYDGSTAPLFFSGRPDVSAGYMASISGPGLLDRRIKRVRLASDPAFTHESLPPENKQLVTSVIRNLRSAYGRRNTSRGVSAWKLVNGAPRLGQSLVLEMK